MNIDKILEYQKKDKDLSLLFKKFKSEPKYISYQKNDTHKKKVYSDMDRLDKMADISESKATKYQLLLDEYKAEMEELKTTVAEIDSFQGANYSTDMIQKLSDKCSKLIKEISNLHNNIQETNIIKDKVIKEGKEISNLYSTSKKEFEELQAEYKPQFDSIQAELKSMKQEIPEEILIKYHALKKNGLSPSIAEYNPSSRQCMGCFEMLSQGMAEKMNKNTGLLECPVCNRLLYTKEQ